MPEYIDREALLEDIAAAEANAGMGVVIAQTLKRYVQRQPAADVEPVRHGRWVHKKTHMWFLDEYGEPDLWRCESEFHNGPECQVCHATPCIHCHPDFMDNECKKGHYVCSECGEQSVDNIKRYCPNCGAKMDGKVEN